MNDAILDEMIHVLLRDFDRQGRKLDSMVDGHPERPAEVERFHDIRGASRLLLKARPTKAPRPRRLHRG